MGLRITRILVKVSLTGRLRATISHRANARRLQSAGFLASVLVDAESGLCRWMEAGLGPTAAAWGQISPLGASGNAKFDYSLSNGSGQLELDSRHWGPIVYPRQEVQEFVRSILKCIGPVKPRHAAKNW